MRKTKWFVYTVGVGLIPSFARLLIYIVTPGVSIDFLLSEIDISVFGLVLNISNINELEHQLDEDESWKATRIGVSLLLIVMFAVLLTLANLNQLSGQFSSSGLQMAAGLLSFGSFVFGYSVYEHLVKKDGSGN